MALDLTPITPKTNRNLTSFQFLLKRLLPVGLLWDFINDTFDSFLQALAEEFLRLYTRSIDLQREAIPGLSDELLSDWEEMTLFPDENTGTTTAERQAILQTKIFNSGLNPTEDYFTAYALSLGITISSFSTPSAPICGIAVCGDSLNGSDFVWQVNWSGGTAAAQANMKAAFERIAPAHTEVIFNPTI